MGDTEAARGGRPGGLGSRIRRLWWVFALLAAGVAAWAFSRPGEAPGLEVGVARATRGPFAREVRATGRVEARVYALTFARAGRVGRVLVREGEAVGAGQALAELETADERDRLRAAREGLAAIEARLSAQGGEAGASRTRLAAQLEAARRTLAASRALLAAGGASQREVDDNARAVRDLEAQLLAQSENVRGTASELEATRASRRQEVESLERSLRQAILRAPVAGTAAEVELLPGVEAGTSAVRLVAAGTLEVRARLPEASIADVRPGQPATVALDAAPDRPLAAKVTRLGVRAEVSGQGGSAVLPVVLRFTAPDAAALARPGLTASVRVTTLRLPDAVQVPLEALVEGGAEGDGGNRVWVVDAENGTARRQAVTVRARDLTRAAVSGLEPNALVVTLPPETLADGARVRYEESAERPGN